MSDSATNYGAGTGVEGSPHGAGDGTRAVRAGLPGAGQARADTARPRVRRPLPSAGEPTGPYTYGRDENPTWTHLERAIRELEAPGQDDVETLVFASGMAARSPRCSSPNCAPVT